MEIVEPLTKLEPDNVTVDPTDPVVGLADIVGLMAF